MNNLSPEAQAELERQLQRKISKRKLRRKLAPYFILFGIPIGIIAAIVTLNNLGIGRTPFVLLIAMVVSGIGFSFAIIGALNLMGIDSEL